MPGFTLYCQYLGVSLDGGLAWWVDCSQVPCTNLPPASTDASANALLSGVTLMPVQLTWNILTGETTLQPYGSTDVVAVIAAPSDYQPGAYSYDAGVWRAWLQMTNCPDCWGIEGAVPPPIVVLGVNLADIDQYSIYESNCEAQAEAAAAAQASSTPIFAMSGGFMAMDEDDGDGGDPCTLTNLLQAFAVTNITQTANGISITFQSCQFFRYLIWEASALSTNTQWTPQAYVWGAPGHSSTTWTDASTTNGDGSTVTQRFYRVQRLLASSIAAGGESSAVIKQDGTLWAWGNNDGELGDGLDSMITGPDGHYVEEYLPYPSDVADVTSCGIQTITNPVAVAAGGDDYTVVVDATGTVWTFGENTSGQLGNGSGPDDNYYPVPSPITGVSNVVAVAAGFEHTLALCANGTVFAWGNDVFGAADGVGGALGAGYDLPSGFTNSPIQSQFPTGTIIVAIAAGNAFSLAVGTNGLLWGWGDNSVGEIGPGVGAGGQASGTNLPVLVPGISNVIAIAAGDNTGGTGGGHSIALTSDKRVWTWGDNDYGELGRNTGALTYDSTPTPVMGLSNVVAIAGGVRFTLAVTSNGQVYAWGDNTFGELGTTSSAVASTNAPMLVTGISNAVWVGAPRYDDGIQGVFSTNDYFGGVHAMAMTVNQGTNYFFGWGDNSYGQVGNDVSGGATNQISQYTPAGPLQFCTRCQREVQLGTAGSFTAQCNGTLYLYFNTDNFGASYVSGSYAAAVNGSNVTVCATNSTGVAVGTVTVGNVYTFSASGYCTYDLNGDSADPNGNPPTNGTAAVCSNINVINITNAPCPIAECFSLVGKIQ